MLKILVFFTYFQVLICLSPAGAKSAKNPSIQKTQANQSEEQSPNNFTWSSQQNMHGKKATMRFWCDTNNTFQFLITQDQKALPQGGFVFIKIQAGNLPPSREGHYGEVIYMGKSTNNKSVALPENRKPFLISKLTNLIEQSLDNRERGLREYDQKIHYCDSLPENKKQACYSSSSGYQVAKPHIMVSMRIDGEKKSESLWFVFNITKPVQNKLKPLACSS